MVQEESMPSKPERRRRSHVRTFTGCQQCRQRHVNETRPTCENCNRMGLSCAAYPFKIDMRVYTPKTVQGVTKKHKRSPSRTKDQSIGDTASSNDSDNSKNATEIIASDIETPGQLVLIPTCHGLQTSPTSLQADPQLILTTIRPSETFDSKFFSHFLSSVSSLLIVYDNPHNANPYRLVFPTLAHDSQALRQAMNALGALHLSNTVPSSRETNYKAMALTRYAQSVSSLRSVLDDSKSPSLSDFATVLLLTFFEMMDSDTNNWQTHLRGAKEIFEKIFDAKNDAVNSSSQDGAVRNFLVSALGYLDVAAAASSARATQIQGAYWETVGGGWQYNLGVPSLNGTIREDDNLQEIRNVWSRLMTIISDVGRFAAEIDSQLPQFAVQRRNTCIMLESKLAEWYSSLPEIFGHLDEGDLSYDQDSVEGACCIMSYFNACVIYYQQIAGITEENQAHLSNAIDAILTTFQRYGKGVSQMGMLWAFFIAGTEARDLPRQDYIRSRMQSMLSFGMGNVKRALQLLELVWIRRNKPEVGLDTRWFAIQKELQWSLLLP